MAAKNGNKLVQMRLDRGLSQTAVAHEIGVHPSDVSRWESGERIPTFSSFRALREAYGVTADALLAAIDSVQRQRQRSGGKAA